MEEIFAELYQERPQDYAEVQGHWNTLHPQKMALFFIIIAVGAQYNLELSVNDPLSEHYCLMSQQCLAAGDFMVRNTISGVQTLVRRQNQGLRADYSACHGAFSPFLGSKGRLFVAALGTLDANHTSRKHRSGSA